MHNYNLRTEISPRRCIFCSELIGKKRKRLQDDDNSIDDMPPPRRTRRILRLPPRKKIVVVGPKDIKITKELFDRMVDKVDHIIDEKNIQLISNASSWSDHVSVMVFLRRQHQKSECELKFQIPCRFDIIKRKFVDGGNPGITLGIYHELFKISTGCDSLGDINKAIYSGAILQYDCESLYTHFNSDVLIAFSWNRDLVGRDDDYASHVWMNSTATKKIHICLYDLYLST